MATTATARKLEIKDFAVRVERLCDFFLTRASEENQRDGSENIKVIEDLKQEAADFQFFHEDVSVTPDALEGLGAYMNGLGVDPKEEN